MVLLIVNWHLELPQFLAVHQYYDSLNIIIDTSQGAKTDPRWYCCLSIL